ncbi:LexA family protein [Parvibacter caecicola]|uniref:Repressor LexA n=1 Tax=Parvibacter caecicola TaxID=747645 RepID=A0A7W5GQQ6_9ACTN|nr:helix-turn-helix domain-containing protein [Parvibacter caecicola]MBB3171766.1 repressor LexA [Parvibacter caecicola]MCR2040672.1 hypothetical protein [Parvibacter caecicola]
MTNETAVFNESLRDLMVQKFGSVAAFSRAADLPPTTVYNVINRGVMSAGFDTVMKIYDTLQIDWASMKFGGPAKSKLPDLSASFIQVPVYGAIAAGTPVEMQEVERHAPVPEEVMGKHPASFLLRVEGDSVNRRIINGYYALVDPEEAEPTNDRDLFAICVNGDSATIKRYRQLANGCELLPDSYDPTYRPIMFDYGQDDTPLVTIIGKVVYAVMPFDFDL